MAKLERKPKANAAAAWLPYLPVAVLVVVVLLLLRHVVDDHCVETALRHIEVGAAVTTKEKPSKTSKEVISDSADSANTGQEQDNRGNNNNNNNDNASNNSFQCPYQSMDDLTQEERNPVKGTRHMVTPPQGGDLHLVCCQSTKGPFNILAHSKWAPLGAKQFLDMVQTDYFSSTVPMMRCVKGFLCQFGISGDPVVSKKWRNGFPDDPNWLPEGPDHRKNEDGVFRFAHGYLAYAGGGKNSRGNQFIVSLKANQRLAGGSPWEVPWGGLVGQHSFDTLGKI